MPIKPPCLLLRWNKYPGVRFFRRKLLSVQSENPNKNCLMPSKDTFKISTIYIPDASLHKLPDLFSHWNLFTVAVNCKDTKIAVSVRTNRPFNGRIYALGRSETCNVDVINSDLFRLDLTMTGQDCNTQSVVSVPVYHNTDFSFWYGNV